MARPKKSTVCPLGGAGVGGKLKVFIWYHLLSGTKRFGELQRLLPDASRQMLTLQLRELEQLGVIQRRVYADLPPKVEYSLTALGQQSEPMLRQFVAWGEWFCDHVGLDYGEWLVDLGSRWKIWIWYLLLSGPKRFGEMQRLLSPVSRQVLAGELRDLERMGVLRRHAYVEGTLKVEYALTDLGQRSEPILRQTYTWGKWACEQLGVEYEWPLTWAAMEASA